MKGFLIAMKNCYYRCWLFRYSHRESWQRNSKNPDVRISIIDKNPYHTMLPELHEVAAGRVEEKSIRISLKRVFAGRRVDIVHDLVESVDTSKRTVTGKKGRYDYDYLVMAAGSRPAYYDIPGAQENTYPLWSYQDAVRLHEHIVNCFRQASEETDGDRRKKLLTFFVVGAGLTGVEMAGELAEYVPVLCEVYEIDREQVKIVNCDFLDRVVTSLPEKLSGKIQKRLEKMGVEVMLSSRVVEVGPENIILEKDSQRVSFDVGTVIWTAGIESAEITQKTAKFLPCSGRGRLLTDDYLRCEKDDRVFIIGDNLCFTPGRNEPVPRWWKTASKAPTQQPTIYTAQLPGMESWSLTGPDSTGQWSAWAGAMGLHG